MFQCLWIETKILTETADQRVDKMLVLSMNVHLLFHGSCVIIIWTDVVVEVEGGTIRFDKCVNRCRPDRRMNEVTDRFGNPSIIVIILVRRHCKFNECQQDLFDDQVMRRIGLL